MTWVDWHRQSEEKASQASLILGAGREEELLALYSEAAHFEENALAEVDAAKVRTFGVLAVSAVSLWYKAGEYRRAEQLALSLLPNEALPTFAAEGLRTLIQAIWAEEAKRSAAVSFIPGQVMISVQGGEVVTGGAPLDLIVEKVQTIQSLFYRTVELLRGMPLRHRGPPTKEIQEACRPWLFQAAPGSYQFAIAMQEPAQKDFFRDDIRPSHVASRFLEIVKATAERSNKALADVVPDEEYRSTFMRLSRNLAPTGKSFERLEIRRVGETTSVFLDPESRSIINQSLRQETKATPEGEGQELTIKGILRAVDLDRDWLDIFVDGDSVHVVDLKETVDDLIGPMVNRPVVVRAIKSKKTSKFVDIEIDE